MIFEFFKLQRLVVICIPDSFARKPFGDWSGVEPPLPFPNRAVKRASAYDTHNLGKIGHRRGTLEQNKRSQFTVFNKETA